MSIQKLGELLKKDCSELTEYDERMVRSYIKGIKDFDDKFTVSFKAGIDLDIQKEKSKDKHSGRASAVPFVVMYMCMTSGI